MYSTPPEFGGLGLAPAQIGTILGVFGVLNGIVQVGCFARVRGWLGQRGTYVLGIVGLGVAFGMFPVLGVLLRWGVGEGEVGWAVWVGIVVQLVAYSFAFMSYGVFLLPSAEVLYLTLLNSLSVPVHCGCSALKGLSRHDERSCAAHCVGCACVSTDDGFIAVFSVIVAGRGGVDGWGGEVFGVWGVGWCYGDRSRLE